MQTKNILIIAVCMFMLGFLVSIAASDNTRYPFSDNDASSDSPGDRISAENLHVFSDRAIIDQEDLIWAKIANTHSMEPVLNAGSISLELPPVVPTEIKVGDIISFDTEERIVIHRVILMGEDPDGWFAVTKGDNNNKPDPHKVRFDDIRGIVVGILY